MARGEEAESRVCRALQRAGWQILARNWRGGGGELDVVAARAGAVHFIEVKARARADGSAVRSITAAKRRRLTRAAEAFLARYTGALTSLHFTVALVEGDQLRWLPDAFDAASR